MTHSCARSHAHRPRPVYTESPIRLPARLTHAEIARLAYSYWEARGYNGGSPGEDWLRAEQELRAR